MPHKLRHLLGGVCFVLLCGVALIGIGEQVAPVYPAARGHTQAMLHEAESIEAITVGHSHNRAIDFEALGVKGWPLWAPGSDIEEAVHVVRAVLPVLPNLDLIFLPIGYGDFEYAHRFQPEHRYGWRRMYHVSLPTWRAYLPIDGDLKNVIRGVFAPLARPDQWKRVSQGLAGGRIPPARETNWYSYAWDRIPVPPRDATWQAAAESLAIEHTDSLAAYVAALPDVADLVKDDIAILVKHARAHDVRVIFYTPPYLPRYAETFQQRRPHTAEQMRQHMEDLQRRLQIEYYDLSQDTTFLHHPDYFDDGSHLSVEGAQVFSRRLKRQARIR